MPAGATRDDGFWLGTGRDLAIRCDAVWHLSHARLCERAGCRLFSDHATAGESASAGDRAAGAVRDAWVFANVAGMRKAGVPAVGELPARAETDSHDGPRS